MDRDEICYTCYRCTRTLSIDEIEDIAFDRNYGEILDQINQEEDPFYGDDSACYFLVEIGLECPNCKNEIEVELSVIGEDGDWDCDGDGMPDFLGFRGWSLDQFYNPLQVRFNRQELVKVKRYNCFCK